MVFRAFTTETRKLSNGAEHGAVLTAPVLFCLSGCYIFGTKIRKLYCSTVFLTLANFGLLGRSVDVIMLW